MTSKKPYYMPATGGSTCQNDNRNVSTENASGWVNIPE